MKAHHYFLLFARRDWKDSRAQKAVPHPLEQGRITLPADNLFIDLSCTIGAHCLAGYHLAVDRELQILECGALGQRKHEIRFTHSAASIDERLRDFIAQHAVGKVDAHVAALSYYDGRRNATRRHDAGSSPLARRWNRAGPGTRWTLDDLS